LVHALGFPDFRFILVRGCVSRFSDGDSIRTDRFRYTKYSKPNGQALYDHKSDPIENINIANQSDQSERTVKLA